MLTNTGLVDYYWDRIWGIWNKREDPEVLTQIFDYLDKIAIQSSDPCIVEETQRTKTVLMNEAEALSKTTSTLKTSPLLSKRNGSDQGEDFCKRISSKQQKTELDEDLPIRIEDLIIVEKPNVTFDEIGGLDVVKEQLKMEIIYPRLYPEKYSLYGRTPGNGILLWGAPGCGKTLLAKAIAKESGQIVFIAPKVSDIMNRWVGESEKIIASILTYARSFSSAALFFDEIDYIAPRSGPSYIMRIKRELLQQMDGMSSKKTGLLLFGATNRPWVLDPAIRRPSPEGLRFSKIILIPPPDLEARKSIFLISLRKTPQEMVAAGLDFDKLAEVSAGFSGADIGAICEEAVDIPLNEYIKGKAPRPVCMDDFLRVISSKPKSIIPWMSDAIKSTKRSGEDYLATQVVAQAQTYLSDEEIDSMLRG